MKFKNEIFFLNYIQLLMSMLVVTALISPESNKVSATATKMKERNYSFYQQLNEFEKKKDLEVRLSYENLNYTVFNNCSNLDECWTDEEALEQMWATAKPRPSHYKFIVLSIIIFVVGLIGNSLVFLAVYRNLSMRTVTNYFIVNLALADLFVIIICLPSTVIWDITQTWFLGSICCKLILYLQTVTVSVSVLTLTFISVDRWYAICYPFQFKSTTNRAKTAIVIIWMVAMIIDLPELWVLDTEPYPKAKGELVFTQCKPMWDLKTSQFFFLVLKLLILYAGPLIFMSIAYYQIIRVLSKSNIPRHSVSTQVGQLNAAVILERTELSTQENFGNLEAQVIKSRRKAAKMLVAVVLMFAVCCLPPHMLDIYRIIFYPVPNSESIQSMSSSIHLLFYANSAINPLIYNFMSGKFRKEFIRAFCCTSVSGNLHGRDEYHMMTAATRVPSTSRLMVMQSIDTII